MLGLEVLGLLAKRMGVDGLGVEAVVKDALADLVEILIVVVFVEGVLLERSVLVLDGPFVAVHTLCFKLIRIRSALLLRHIIAEGRLDGVT